MEVTKAQARPPNRSLRRPVLQFSPLAWAKLLYLRDLGPTEVGMFGISYTSDLLYVEDVVLIPQHCTAVSVKFTDDGIADYFDEQVALGRQPEQFARIWIHTHPGNSARPSGTDEETFARSFAGTDWAVMFILAQGGQTYTRLRFAAGPSGQFEIAMEVDFYGEFSGTDQRGWEAAYKQMVHPDDPFWLDGSETALFDPTFLMAWDQVEDAEMIWQSPSWHDEFEEAFW